MMTRRQKEAARMAELQHNAAEGMKVCCDCMEAKPIDDFRKIPAQVARRPQCRLCENKSARERYHSSGVARQKAKMRKRRSGERWRNNKNLTTQERCLLETARAYFRDRGYFPSYEYLKQSEKISSAAQVSLIVSRLEKKSFLYRTPGATRWRGSLEIVDYTPPPSAAMIDAGMEKQQDGIIREDEMRECIAEIYIAMETARKKN